MSTHTAERTAGDQHLDSILPWLNTMSAIDLATLDAGAALLQRVDRKYLVSLATFGRLLSRLQHHGDWAVLQIGGTRLFTYESVYFDTPALTTYRAHLQQRRRRFKVRVRSYVDSGQCMLEVKRKGAGGMTLKERQPHDPARRLELGPEALRFVEDAIAPTGRPHGASRVDVRELRPIAATSNRRATLASLEAGARLTVDTDLLCGGTQSAVALRPGYVLLESKVEGHAGFADRLLWSLGARPLSISKYCVAVAALGLDLPSNPWRRTMQSYFTSDLGPAE